MKNIIIKTICILLLVLVLYTPSAVYASSLDDVIASGDSFLQAADKDEKINTQALKGTSDYIYNTLFIIAIVAAVITGTIMGIQFIMGSVEEQAKIKESLVPFIVGVIVVVASFTIWKVVVNIGNSLA